MNTTNNEQLRDEFAKQAMLGLMGSSWNLSSFDEIGIKAYEMADKMLAARNGELSTKQYLPYEYKALEFWGENMRSHFSYVQRQQREAAADRAPLDAIYKRDGKWATLRDVENEDVLKRARKLGLIA